jgi:hypothetical protein
LKTGRYSGEIFETWKIFGRNFWKLLDISKKLSDIRKKLVSTVRYSGETVED